MRVVLATKFDYVLGKEKDPLGQWTSQEFMSYDTGIKHDRERRLIPRRTVRSREAEEAVRVCGFQSGQLLLCVSGKHCQVDISAGAIAPLAICALFKWRPESKMRFQLWYVSLQACAHSRNTTIFFSGAAHFYGNLSTIPFTQFLLGTFTNFYLFRYKHAFWNK